MRVIKNKIAKRRLVHLAVGVLALPLLAFGATSVFMELQAHATGGEFSWKELSAGEETVPVYGIEGVALSSDGSKIAVIGEYGNRLYTSVDSGATWKASLHVSNNYLRSIFASENGDTLVALSNSGIHTSTDWGETWSVQTSVVSEADNFDLLSSSTDGSKIVAAANNPYSDSSIYTSSDYGQTWEMQPSAGINHWRSLRVSADGSKIAAISDDNRVHTSDDFGITWSVVAQDVDFFQSRTSSSADGSIVVSSSNDSYLYLSTDYGQTWEQSIYLTTSLVDISMSDDGSVIMITNQGSLIQLSTDSGNTWSVISPADESNWSQGSVSADGNKLSVIAGNKVYTSSDQGQTWSDIQPTKKQHPQWTTVASSADGKKIAAIAFYNESVYLSSDSGDTWTTRVPEAGENWSSVTSSDDGVNLALTSSSGFIYTSNDSGNTWQLRSSSGNRQWTAITSSADGSKLFATTLGTYSDASVVMSEDYGQTWEESLSASIERWSYIAVSPDGEKVAVLTTNGFELYTSSDGGDSWQATAVAGNPTYIGSIEYGGKGSLYLTSITIDETGPSTDAYKSEDNGTTWSPIPTGDGAVTMILADQDESRLVALSLYNFIEDGGANAYQLLKTSSDSAQTWTEQPVSEAIANDTALLHMAKDGNTVILTNSSTSGPLVIGKRDSPDPSPTTPTLNLDDSAPTSTNPDAPQKITNKRPTFSGVAYPFAEIVVTVNSDPIVCTTVADASGNWSCTLPSDVPAGVHSVVVQVTNPDTNEVEELGPYYIQAGETVDDETPVGGGSGAGGDPNTPNTGAEKRATANPALLTALAALSVLSLVAVAKLRKQ